MAHESAPVDMSNAPSLPELVEEVRRTKRPLAIRADGKVVAEIVPAQPVVKQARHVRAGKKDASIAALAGAAGTLRQPMLWQEMREIAWEDHIAEKFGQS